MPRKPTVFSESLIKSLPAEEIEYVRSHNGLRIRVYPNGTKAWSYFKTAPNGSRKSIHLGIYPSISYKQARELADRNLGEMLKTGHDISLGKNVIKFGDYIASNEYLSWSKSNRPAHKTIIQNLQNVIPVWMHRKPLNTFANADFQKFVDARLNEGVMPSTINRNLNNIRSVFSRAFMHKVIKENPMKTFSNLKEDKQISKRSLTDDERKRLIKVSRDRTLPQADKRLYMEIFIELGLYTGMRKSELTQIKWKNFKNDALVTRELPTEVFKDKKKRMYQSMDKEITGLKVNFKKGMHEGSDLALEMKALMQSDKQEDMVLLQHLIRHKAPIDAPINVEFKQDKDIVWYIEIDGTFTKARKGRLIGVPTHLVERIRQYLWNRELSKPKSLLDKYQDYAFFDENLNIVRSNSTTAMGAFDEEDIIPVKDCKKSFGTLCEIAGLKQVSIHTMRHDFCTQLVKKGIDIYTVKNLAGHEDIRTTEEYLHALNKKDFKALESMHDDKSI